jgi:cytochrome c oxidase subunit 4
VLTIAAASFNFGSANVVIALAIASVKATLVALFFMHLVWDKPVNAIIAIAGFLFLGIFLMFDFLDVTSRVNFLPNNMPNMENATPAPDSMNPQRTAPPRPLQAAPATAPGVKEEHK